jgi:hypothetical protein
MTAATAGEVTAAEVTAAGEVTMAVGPVEVEVEVMAAG